MVLKKQTKRHAGHLFILRRRWTSRRKGRKKDYGTHVGKQCYPINVCAQRAAEIRLLSYITWMKATGYCWLPGTLQQDLSVWAGDVDSFGVKVEDKGLSLCAFAVFSPIEKSCFDHTSQVNFIYTAQCKKNKRCSNLLTEESDVYLRNQTQKWRIINDKWSEILCTQAYLREGSID